MAEKIKIELTVTAYFTPTPDMTLGDWKYAALTDPDIVFCDPEAKIKAVVELVEVPDA